jgi:hypothetical protein
MALPSTRNRCLLPERNAASRSGVAPEVGVKARASVVVSTFVMWMMLSRSNRPIVWLSNRRWSSKRAVVMS